MLSPLNQSPPEGKMPEKKPSDGEHRQIYEFYELIDTFQIAKEEIEYVNEETASEEEIQQVMRNATNTINLSLQSFLQTMRHLNQIETELLFLCIANRFGFCVETHEFQSLLRSEDIRLMNSKMQESYKEYSNLREQCVHKAQAFVLLTGLESVCGQTKISLKQKQDCISFMKQHLAGLFSCDVDCMLNHYTDNSQWEHLEEDLKTLIYHQRNRKNKDLKTHQYFQDHKTISNATEDIFKKHLKTESNQNVLNLLKELDLIEYYPQKMKIADFHVISKYSLNEDETISTEQLPFQFLQRLLMLDYRARYLQCKPENDSASGTRIINAENKSSKTFNSFFNESDDEGDVVTPETNKVIHPMDVQMAIFHCADDFTRQYIYTKLSVCQFALPLLIPNTDAKDIEFPLWLFRNLKKTWKGKSTVNAAKPIIETDTPVVSFIRLGTSLTSKSQIINSLMSKKKHDTFFHRHCIGSTKNSLLMKGVVEVAWYCPGGTEDDLFDDCIAFTNLHGDAREHEKQLYFLQEISSVNVIFVTSSEINDEKCKQVLEHFYNSSKPLICLLTDKERTQQKSGLNVKIGIKNRNEAELINELTCAIKKIVSISKVTTSLDSCANIARNYEFIIDEDQTLCNEGRTMTNVILSLLQKKKLSAMKEKFLPLQGYLWHTWCKNDKELTRLKGKTNLSIEQYRDNIEAEKNNLRQKQLQRAFPLNDFMRSFLEILHSNSQSLIMYFLHWFKMCLDKLSSEKLSVLYEEYHELWSKLSVEKEKKNSNEFIETQQRRLEEISKQINDSTFGLEHILRELGQIYEAQETFPTSEKCSFSLPEIAATLMVSGYPIELMDGDAAHVPLRWIRAVLDKLIAMLGDLKLFVLSVLGIQSSGKSTLLNAMFGLQFAVSAGRCTRGAFMQLVKVDEHLRKELNFDYVLVIDTEGLRAPELCNKDTMSHDNELATFVIGLGNLTLINIFGENPSEMQDILQIAVQAFLRMKQVNLRPSCLFVHQNVGELTAKEKTMEGRRRLQEKLDEMTLTAAQQEHSEIKCFNEVIKFDVNTHLHYFAHLWEGDPPMAPPNPSYSRNVQFLKNIILDTGKKESPNNILKVSDFKNRVCDLWKALLTENFVFSFKNSLEIAVYNKLEIKYGQWTWELREHMLILQNRMDVQIRKGEIKTVEIPYLHRQLQEPNDKVMEDLEMFFSDKSDEAILIQWKANTQNRLSTVKQDLIEQTRKKLNQLIISNDSRRKIDEMEGHYEGELFQRSKELALKLKGKELSEDELRQNFNTLWNSWIAEVKKRSPSIVPPNIDLDVEIALLENFGKEFDVLTIIKDSSKWFFFPEVFINFISPNVKWYFITKLSNADKEKVKLITCALEKLIDEYIEGKKQKKIDYQKDYFYEILHKIKIELKDLMHGFKFKNEYTMLVSVYLCRKAVRSFQQMSKDFQETNKPHIHLENKRDYFFQSFKCSCEGKKKIASFADLLCAKLKEAIQQAVYEKAAIDIAREMRCNYPAFSGNRSNLENYILKSLAEKEDFPAYYEYIHYPKSSFKNFIQQCIEDYLLDESCSRLSTFLNTSMDHYKTLILTAIENSMKKIEKVKSTVSLWLDTFCSELGDNINILRSDFKSVDHQGIDDIDFLKEAMSKALEIVAQQLNKDFSVNDMTKFRSKPHEILLDQLAGCWHQCPFCNAICTNTLSEHDGDHSVQFHRPNGLTGRYYKNTDQFVTDICTSLVAGNGSFCISHDSNVTVLDKNYRTAGPPYSNWSITPDSSSQKYWKWVVCRFQSDLENQHKMKFVGLGKIPELWKKISKEDVISELEIK
ncbi:interferon-induced very large GTPase 1 [Bombina bombina]|uniref:interferon-induced very large GTPase 1 n=1 Tax=Bombina bombina TaxID=8345 RepID=UPI00235B04A2|nr:interferon-induced very large GTPase 1 [Bombina bombina]XP_053565452.1 interferon-induced very large GTPase 1 [Bombina bombina]XP_053565453.1 interferon-induced very large GTPase 1 [Bombina bombina]